MPLLVYASATVLAVINALVSIAILRSIQYSRAQKIAQVLLVWVFPAAGALVVWLVLSHTATERRPDHYPDQLAGLGDYSQGPPFHHDHGDIGAGDVGADGH